MRVDGFGLTGVSGGCSEELVFCRVGSVGGAGSFTLLALTSDPVSLSSWLTDVMVC